jgi:mono/diheme cytochrome c family protein
LSGIHAVTAAGKTALALAAALLLLASAAAAQSSAPSDSSRSAAQGVYVAAQATAGEAVFGSTCGNCHGPPEFKGPTFRRVWEGRSVFDLFDQIRNNMPLDNPGGLSREQYTNVIAYLLRINDYPAGAVELPATDDALKRISF